MENSTLSSILSFIVALYCISGQNLQSKINTISQPFLKGKRNESGEQRATDAKNMHKCSCEDFDYSIPTLFTCAWFWVDLLCNLDPPRQNENPSGGLRQKFMYEYVVPRRSVHRQTDHATIRPTPSVHPTNRPL